MIIAALLGALTFGACVDSQESASVEAVRNAKAEQLKSIATLNNAKAQAEATIAAAEAQLAAAQAQLIAAEAAALNAATEAEKIANQIAAAQAAQTIAQIEAQMELDKIAYEAALLKAQLEFNATKDAHIQSLYAAYTQDLKDLNDAQTALAAAKATLAAAEKGLASVEETYNKTLAAAEKTLADHQSKKAAKEAELATLRAAAEGGMSKSEAYAAWEKAYAAATAALQETFVTTELEEAASKAMHNAYYNFAKADYYKNLQSFTSLARGIFDLYSVSDNKGNDYLAFLPYYWDIYGKNIITGSNKNKMGAFVQSDDAEDAVVLFDGENYKSDNKKKVENITLSYDTRTTLYGIDAEAADLLATQWEAIIEAKEGLIYERAVTSTEVALEAAENATINKEKVDLFEEIESISEEMDAIIEEAAELYVSITEKEVEWALVNGFDAEAADKLVKEITALKKEIEALEKEYTDLEADLEELESNELIEDYLAAVAAEKAAKKAYDDAVAKKDKAIACLEAMVEGYADFAAEHIDGYNALVNNWVEAWANDEAKLIAWQKAVNVAGVYAELYQFYEEEYGKAEGSTEAWVSSRIDVVVAELKTIADNIKAAEKAIKSLSLAAETATKEQAVATAQAAVADAEYQVAVAEANLATTKAALDAALAM